MDQNHAMNDSINISDVIDAIENTDPGVVERTVTCKDRHSLNIMSGARIETATPVSSVSSGSNIPFVKIIEQPASKALRFRYECEGRSAGSIPGINSTPDNKTYPSIKIVGYQGRAVVVVSCVTKDPPYKPHPHNLVGKETCKRGVCTVEIAPENMTMTFAGLGIQCVKKKDIEEALKIREDIRVDPFRTGFEHKRQPTSIDLNAVRLCFQVFIEGSEKGKFTVPLPSIVSDPIYDKKAMSDLVICKLSHCSASVAGGMEMILLCEKVSKEDIQIRFFEERNGQVVWEALANFQPSHVHKQVAITFRTPSYCNQLIEQPAHVCIQLMRPSDHATSDALPFQMVPLGADDPDSLKRKRQKFNNCPSSNVIRYIPAGVEKHAEMLVPISSIQCNFNLVKPEPIDMISYDDDIAACTLPLYPGTNNYLSAAGPDLSTSRRSQHQNLTLHYQSTLKSAHQDFEPQVIVYNDEQMILDRVASKPSEIVGVQQLPIDIDGSNGAFDLDNNQFSFDMSQLGSFNQLNSAELAVLGTALSENFSSGLSISDVSKTHSIKGLRETAVKNMEESTSMSDSLSRLTDTTIQELCTLNSLYKPIKDNLE